MVHNILSSNRHLHTTDNGLGEGKTGTIIALRQSTSSTCRAQVLGYFRRCILWTSKTKTKVNTTTSWGNYKSKILHSSFGGVPDVRWTVGVI